MTDVQRIVFHDVSYAYSPDSPILKHADLQLERGGLHVITGPSGVGKSTTLNLLLGLLRPQQGKVEVVEGNHATGTRHGIALVEQEPFFFHGTLYDNLCMGRNGIETADILQYLDRLHLSHLFPSADSLTEKTEMFSRRLSTGEKQRLALIRALVGKPAVLVVDEVTSNIDAETSQLIIALLQQLSRQLLVVAVSHDPVLIAHADVTHRLSGGTFTSTMEHPIENNIKS